MKNKIVIGNTDYEKLTVEEYHEKIGEWLDMSPEEIVDEMCELIKKI